MKVDLRTLKDNPFRDFRIDPIDDAAVEALRVSIAENGFWGGVVCRGADDENFFALVTRAELIEISLTDRPANPLAVVRHRYPVSAAAEFYSIMADHVARLQDVVIALKMMTREVRT